MTEEQQLQSISEYITQEREQKTAYKEIYRQLMEKGYSRRLVSELIGIYKKAEMSENVSNVATASLGSEARETKKQAQDILTHAPKIIRRRYRDYVVQTGNPPTGKYMAHYGDVKIFQAQIELANQICKALGYQFKHRTAVNTYQTKVLPKFRMNGTSWRLVKI